MNMAKKRKSRKKSKRSKKTEKRQVKRKAKKKVRRVKTRARPMRKMPRERAPTTIQSAYLLFLTGSIIVFVAGILALFFDQLALPKYIFWSIFCGLGMLIATALIRKAPKIIAMVILLLSIVALILPPHGFIVGPVLALIGSVILLLKK